MQAGEAGRGVGGVPMRTKSDGSSARAGGTGRGEPKGGEEGVMKGKYVPPHLRGKAANKDTSDVRLTRALRGAPPGDSPAWRPTVPFGTEILDRLESAGLGFRVLGYHKA